MDGANREVVKKFKNDTHVFGIDTSGGEWVKIITFTARVKIVAYNLKLQIGKLWPNIYGTSSTHGF